MTANQDAEAQVALLSVLEELTIAALELFYPERTLDSYFERVAERLGCSAVVCLEYRSGGSQLRLLGDAGLSSSSRTSSVIPLAPEQTDPATVREALSVGGSILRFPEIRQGNPLRWCFELEDLECCGGPRIFFIVLCFSGSPPRDHRYRAMMERALSSFKAALLHREVYARTLFQKALLESQNDAALEGIVIVSSDGHVISFNRKFVEMWKIEDQKLRGLPMARLLDRLASGVTDPELCRRRMMEAVTDGSDPLTCGELQLKQGSVFECCSVPIRRSGGPDYGRGLYFRDITERKLAEQKLVQLLTYEQDLRCQAQRAERRNALLAEVSRQLGAARFNLEMIQRLLTRLVVPELADYSIFYECSGEAEAGALPAKAVGHLDSSRADAVMVRLARPGGALTVSDADSLLWEKGSCLNPPLSDGSLLKSVLRELGCESWMVIPIHVKGHALGLVCFVLNRPNSFYGKADLDFARELVSRATLSFENAMLYQEVCGAVRERDAFLAVASHELRTPVTSIRAVSQLLVRQFAAGGNPMSEQVRRMARLLDEQSDRLARLVGQLLDVTQIELGKLKLVPREVDLSRLAQQIVEAAQARYPGLSFELKKPGPLPAVVDPIRLEQVLVNLIENAFKYAHEGRRVEVEVAREGGGAEFRLSVRDYGRGIPEDLRDRLFQRFERAKRDEARAGLGIGLYLCRQIVELHGGKIQVEAPAGGGTRFVITAPIRSGSARNLVSAA